MMQTEKRNKILIIVSVVLFFGLIVTLWFFLAGPGRKMPVEIFVVPSDASVKVDGKMIETDKSVSLSPGKHTFSASRQYFDSIEIEVNIDDLGADKTVYLAIYPNSPEGEAFLEEHPEEKLRYERVGGAQFDATQRLLKNYPVTDKLPYQTLDYKIDFDVTKDRQVVFLVTFYPPNAVVPGTNPYKDFLDRAKADALEYLGSEGVDIESAEIRYTPDPNKQ